MSITLVGFNATGQCESGFIIQVWNPLVRRRMHVDVGTGCVLVFTASWWYNFKRPAPSTVVRTKVHRALLDDQTGI